MLSGIEFNDLLSVLNIGVLVWVAKRQVGRIDALVRVVHSLKERVAKIEGRLKHLVE